MVRWRCQAEGAAQAGVHLGSSFFSEIDPSFLFHLSSWRLKLFGRWSRPEDIMRLEGRALIAGDAARASAEAAWPRALGETAVQRDIVEHERFLGDVEQRDQPGRDHSGQGTAEPHAVTSDAVGCLVTAAVRSGRKVVRSEVLRRQRAVARFDRCAHMRSDVEPGLSFLQTNKVKPPTRTAFRERARNFLEWANEGSLEEIAVTRLDQLAAKYLDVLFFGGMEVGEGSRLLAALQHLRPSLGTAKHGNIPVARAAMAGFRRRAHGTSREPLCRPWVIALVGVSLLLKDLGFAAALWLAWGGMLRLPSDLVSLTTKSLIGPGRGKTPRWALLLRLSGEEARSKIMGADEGVILLEPAWRQGGGSALRRVRSARGPNCPLRSFDGPTFTRRFEERLAAIPGAPSAVPYQVRHGGASHAAALQGLPLAGIGERLRRANPHISLRYAKHVRYLSPLDQAPLAVTEWSDKVMARLGPLLDGTESLEAPAFMQPAVLAGLRASYATVFLGSPECVCVVLRALAEGAASAPVPFDLCAVVSQPPKRVRNKPATKTPVHELAEELGIEHVWTPGNAKYEPFLEALEDQSWPQTCASPRRTGTTCPRGSSGPPGWAP
ncbi:unnamed protein product [Prorocentrum cordatum]|uniref:Uncharacterized protein n=1 Tax=Prorocentrum cordatum TaxID=2364126 RepID=A0ABN9QGZ4_9DINO|nr:unnamed protein product [Polarella glacialis]